MSDFSHCAFSMLITYVACAVYPLSSPQNCLNLFDNSDLDEKYLFRLETLSLNDNFRLLVLS